MKLSQAGLDLIKQHEGLQLQPYLCPAAVATIGYGHAITEDGQQLVGQTGLLRARELYPHGLTLAEAESLLREDVETFERAVLKLVTVPLTENQFAALVSFAYNVGPKALERSTLLRKLNAGDYTGTAAEFARWNKAGGRVLPGLVKRRAEERELFLK